MCVTVVLRHNDGLELNRVDYFGSVTLAELEGLAEFQAANPTWLTYDTLNLVAAGTDFRSVSLDALDGLFARYRVLFAPLTLLILRRSAWLCQSAAAHAHIRHWIGDRDMRGGMSSDVRSFESIEAAGEWLVLSSAELDMVHNCEGFAERARIHHPPAPAAAR